MTKVSRLIGFHQELQGSGALDEAQLFKDIKSTETDNVKSIFCPQVHPEMSHCSTFLFVLLEVYNNRRFLTVRNFTPEPFFTT